MKDYFSLALNNLKRRRLRSWLTMIGIFIGIAAVVSLISLGQGLQDYISGEFEKLGADKIIIQPKGFGTPGASGPSLILTSDDLEFIRDIKGVEWASGYLMKQGVAEYRDEIGVGYAVGIDEDGMNRLLEMSDLEIEGRSFKQGEKFKVVVGNDHVHGDIWENPIEIGSTIILEGKEFKIIGIMEKIGNPIDDGSVYVPKEALRELIEVEDEESQIVVKADEGFDPEEVAETIERKLRKFRGEKEDQETFIVQTSGQLLDSFQSIFAVVQGVLVGIAAISLLVGGIGIMNTMYTSVLERTKEIGTMKAVGAKNSDVLLLFLIESGLLGLIGGAIGVLIGIGLAKGAEFIAAQALGTTLLQASTNPVIYLGALAFSFVVGAISGVFPAMQASKLRPADALRYE